MAYVIIIVMVVVAMVVWQLLTGLDARQSLGIKSDAQKSYEEYLKKKYK